MLPITAETCESSAGLGLFLSTYRGLPIVEHDGALFGYRNNILLKDALKIARLDLNADVEGITVQYFRDALRYPKKRKNGDMGSGGTLENLLGSTGTPKCKS